MKINVNELRRGNKVLFVDDNSIFTVISITENGLDVANDNEFVYIEIENFEPIPLTEEWLEKFGLEKEEGEYGKCWLSPIVDDGRRIRILPCVNSAVFLWQYNMMSSVKIKYVHQLQNLYFALTGEELEIK